MGGVAEFQPPKSRSPILRLLLNTASNNKAWIFTVVPAIFMYVMSTWALVRLFLTYTVKDGIFNLPASINVLIPIMCVIYLDGH